MGFSGSKRAAPGASVRRALWRDEAGFTLIEMITALLVFAIVSSMMVAVVYHFTRANAVTHDWSVSQVDAQMAMAQIVRGGAAYPGLIGATSVTLCGATAEPYPEVVYQADATVDDANQAVTLHIYIDPDTDELVKARSYTDGSGTEVDTVVHLLKSAASLGFLRAITDTEAANYDKVVEIALDFSARTVSSTTTETYTSAAGLRNGTLTAPQETCP